jgi:hypothetical protein
MSEILKFFLDFFNPNNETKGSDRFILLVILILCLFVLNTIFNFTTQYRFANNLENIRNIEQLNRYNLEESTKAFLDDQRERIIREENFNEADLYEMPKTVLLEYLNYKKFRFWHYITSSWLFVVILLYVPVSLFKRNTILPGTFFLSRLFTITIIFLLTYVLSLLYAWVLEFIPIISLNYLWINYIINFFSIFIVFGFMYFLYSIFNLRKTEYLSDSGEKNKKSIKNNLKLKSKKSDILDFPDELKKVIGEKNPIFWSQEIVRYYATSGGNLRNIAFAIFVIAGLLFTIYAYYITLKYLLY